MLESLLVENIERHSNQTCLNCWDVCMKTCNYYLAVCDDGFILQTVQSKISVHIIYVQSDLALHSPLLLNYSVPSTKLTQNLLSLSQTTTFRLFHTERACTRKFQNLMKMPESSPNV